jgi:hypothetical protein
VLRVIAGTRLRPCLIILHHCLPNLHSVTVICSYPAMNSGPSGAQTMSSAFSRVLSPLTICYRYFQNYCHLFGVSCLVYDHAVTLGALTLIVLLQRILIIYFLEDRECSFVWTHTKTASAYWFFILRYGALMTNIPVIVFSFVTLPWPKVSLLDSDSFGLLIEGLLVVRSSLISAQSFTDFLF